MEISTNPYKVHKNIHKQNYIQFYAIVNFIGSYFKNIFIFHAINKFIVHILRSATQAADLKYFRNTINPQGQTAICKSDCTIRLPPLADSDFPVHTPGRLS